MFLDESAFEMEENPYRDGGFQSRSTDSGYTSRPSTGGGGGSLDFSRGSRHQGRGGNDNNMMAMAIKDPEEEDLGGGDPYGRGSTAGGNSRARMLAQQRDIQLKKRMSAVQAGGMVRSSFENPLALPGKSSSRPPTADSQSTPAVRQFSAPKSISTSDEYPGSSEFTSSRKASVERENIAQQQQQQQQQQVREKRQPAERPPPRRSYADEDDDDQDDDYAPRGGRRNGPSSQHRGSQDSDEDDSYNNRTSRRQPQQPRDRRAPRDYDDDDDEYGGRQEQQQQYGRDKGRSNRQYADYDDRDRDDDDDDYNNDDDYNDRNGRGNYSRGGRQQPQQQPQQSRRGGDDRRGNDYSRDRDMEDDRDWDRERGAQARNFRGDPRREEEDGRKQWPGSKSGRNDAVEERVSPKTASVPLPLNLSNMKAFLTTPIPKGSGIVQCYIRRFKSATSLYPTYNLYLKDGDRFLLTAKKRPNNKTSNYLISMVFNDLNRDSTNYLGKVRSNFVGTEFQIFDNGVNPEKLDPGSSDANVRKELGGVTYAANILGTRGPRKMQVCLPAVDENDRIMPWTSVIKDGQDDIVDRIKERNFRDLIYLINKPPRWNEQVGAYVLNFNGRVTMASVKNFQLVDPDEQNAVVLQFGRVSKDEFSMDMQWPISPLQAFAITMTSFDSKIACD